MKTVIALVLVTLTLFGCGSKNAAEPAQPVIGTQLKCADVYNEGVVSRCDEAPIAWYDWLMPTAKPQRPSLMVVLSSVTAYSLCIQ